MLPSKKPAGDAWSAEVMVQYLFVKAPVLQFMGASSISNPLKHELKWNRADTPETRDGSIINDDTVFS